MELTGSALTALFVGMAWALINVVKYFISKYGKSSITKTELIDEQAKVLSNIHLKLQESSVLIKEQGEILKETLANLKRLYEMHTVYNDNHVPAWYVPKDLIELMRDVHNRLKDLNEDLDEIKGRETSIAFNMSELVGSQKLMTERLGDLISALSKLSR